MIPKFFIIITVLAVVVGIGISMSVFAQAPNPNSLEGGINRIKQDVAGQDAGLLGGNGVTVGVGTVTENIIAWLLGLAGVLALLALVTGGIMYILSFGNEQRAETAKRILIYAIVGLLIVGGSFVIISVVRTVLIGSLVTPAFAQEIDPVRGLDDGFNEVDRFRDEEAGVQDFGTPEAFIENILEVLLGIVAIIAAAVLVYGGFLYITSAGDETKAEKAKKLIIYAIVGLIIIGVSALIVNIVIGIFRG